MAGAISPFSFSIVNFTPKLKKKKMLEIERESEAMSSEQCSE